MGFARANLYSVLDVDRSAEECPFQDLKGTRFLTREITQHINRNSGKTYKRPCIIT